MTTGNEHVWRVIETDSENLTGVAPVCPQQRATSGEHHWYEPGVEEGFHEDSVYDCCPGPHLEVHSRQGAREVAELLTRWEVTVCE